MYQVIKWGGGIIGHASKEMPAGGSRSWPSTAAMRRRPDQRIKELVRYLESIQVKGAAGAEPVEAKQPVTLCLLGRGPLMSLANV